MVPSRHDKCVTPAQKSGCDSKWVDLHSLGKVRTSHVLFHGIEIFCLTLYFRQGLYMNTYA